MRVLLTAAPFYSDPRQLRHLDNSANLGIYLLAAIAERAGHEAGVVDPCTGPSRLSEADFTRTFADCDLIGLSATTSTWAETRLLLERLQRELPRRPVTVLGGPHASLFDERALRSAPLDYVARGEGERVFPELLRALADGRDPAGMPGLSCLRGGEYRRGPDRPPLDESELAALPLPRYDLIPAGYYQAMPVETSRGCWHRCVFCGIASHRRWRETGTQRLRAALALASAEIGKYTRGAVHIIDDCFLARGRELAPLAAALAGFSIPLALSTRVNDLRRPEALDFFSTLPVAVCELGVECGYDEGIEKVGKGITTRDVLELAAVLRGRGLADRILYAYIVGLPWESRKECLETLKFAFALGHVHGGRVQVGWFLLYPGSEIYFNQERYGLAVGPEIYDRAHFWRDGEVFARMHPRLTVADERDVVYTARFLASMHPEIKSFLMM